MSGTPNKRGAHEEGGSGGGPGAGQGHSSSVSKYSLDDSSAFANVGTKITSSASNEYHQHFDVGQDSRMPTKIPRLDSRDSDRRSPLLPMYRVSPSPLNDSHSEHPVILENRIDDNRDPKVENNRDGKMESMDFYLGAKNDKDVRFEGRGDDSKETKCDRDPYSEYKGEIKMEKDCYGAATSYLNWKESKEHHRAKRYPDIPVAGNADPWHTSRVNLHCAIEIGKECSTTEERDHVEGHEFPGENKVDDRFKEKDRKRKDGKHRDWGETNKERPDRRTTLQIGNISVEGRESTREERDVERWEKERERKDSSKDKEKPKEKEKEHIKKEAWNGVEKEGLRHDRELVDQSGRTMEQENLSFEQKKQKDHESWKIVDKEARERRKERDVDMEGERPEKRGRFYDKESDDGCVDGEGAPERERELFNHGVQQRKRMLRPRGSPQLANRDPRSRSRPQDNEGYSFMLH